MSEEWKLLKTILRGWLFALLVSLVNVGAVPTQAQPGPDQATVARWLGINHPTGVNLTDYSQQIARTVQDRFAAGQLTSGARGPASGGLPSNLNGAAPFSAAVLTALGGRSSLFQEALALADIDGREDLVAARDGRERHVAGDDLPGDAARLGRPQRPHEPLTLLRPQHRLGLALEAPALPTGEADVEHRAGAVGYRVLIPEGPPVEDEELGELAEAHAAMDAAGRGDRRELEEALAAGPEQCRERPRIGCAPQGADGRLARRPVVDHLVVDRKSGV